MKPKTLLVEFSILVIVFAFYWYVLFRFTHSVQITHLRLEINLHDTYFIYPLSWKLITIPYSFLVAIIYFIKEAFYAYRRILQNGIFAAANFIFVILIMIYPLFIMDLLFPAHKQGWTVYPPLSALPNTYPDTADWILWGNISFLPDLIRYCIYASMLSVVMLVVSSVAFGRSLKWTNKGNTN
ncbi:hypothetical protein [Mucilaginibacter sp.]